MSTAMNTNGHQSAATRILLNADPDGLYTLAARLRVEGGFVAGVVAGMIYVHTETGTWHLLRREAVEVLRQINEAP